MSALLAQLEDCMDEKQYAYYSLVCSRLTKDPAEKMEWYQKVQHGLENTLGMSCLISGYYEQANTTRFTGWRTVL